MCLFKYIFDVGEEVIGDAKPCLLGGPFHGWDGGRFVSCSIWCNNAVEVRFGPCLQ